MKTKLSVLLKLRIEVDATEKIVKVKAHKRIVSVFHCQGWAGNT